MSRGAGAGVPVRAGGPRPRTPAPAGAAGHQAPEAHGGGTGPGPPALLTPCQGGLACSSKPEEPQQITRTSTRSRLPCVTVSSGLSRHSFRVRVPPEDSPQGGKWVAQGTWQKTRHLLRTKVQTACADLRGRNSQGSRPRALMSLVHVLNQGLSDFFLLSLH